MESSKNESSQKVTISLVIEDWLGDLTTDHFDCPVRFVDLLLYPGSDYATVDTEEA